MSSYRLGPEYFNEDEAHSHSILTQAYLQKQRPLCMCKPNGVQMYIAKIAGKHVLKRMPNTGSDHSPNCDSFEAPPELSGFGQVSGSAIHEDADSGMTTLRLDFALSKVGRRAAPVPSGVAGDTVSTEGSKLTLLSLLHYLWDQAGFNRWAPAMEARRTWPVVRKFLITAASDKTTKGHHLADSLYLPEPYRHDARNEIRSRRQAILAGIAVAEKGARKLKVLIGEVKEIGEARFGKKIVVKHAPDYFFMLADDLHSRLMKRFERELGLWSGIEDSRLIVIATFSVNPSGFASIEELSLMNTNSNWIPIELDFDRELIDKLIAGKRRFIRGLRYNLSLERPLAVAVLSDTGEKPTAMYVEASGASDEYRTALEDLIKGSSLEAWRWRAGQEPMPALPTAVARPFTGSARKAHSRPVFTPEAAEWLESYDEGTEIGDRRETKENRKAIFGAEAEFVAEKIKEHGEPAATEAVAAGLLETKDTGHASHHQETTAHAEALEDDHPAGRSVDKAAAGPHSEPSAAAYDHVMFDPFAKQISR